MENENEIQLELASSSSFELPPTTTTAAAAAFEEIKEDIVIWNWDTMSL
jgi:hypothetical protein